MLFANDTRHMPVVRSVLLQLDIPSIYSLVGQIPTCYLGDSPLSPRKGMFGSSSGK